MMNRNRLLFSIALSGGCAALWAQNAARSNVLLIYADDLGYGDLECYDAKNVKTPHVNALAQDGILFTNAHAVAATSIPRVTLCLQANMPGARKERMWQPEMPV